MTINVLQKTEGSSVIRVNKHIQKDREGAIQRRVWLARVDTPRPSLDESTLKAEIVQAFKSAMLGDQEFINASTGEQQLWEMLIKYRGEAFVDLKTFGVDHWQVVALLAQGLVNAKRLKADLRSREREQCNTRLLDGTVIVNYDDTDVLADLFTAGLVTSPDFDAVLTPAGYFVGYQVIHREGIGLSLDFTPRLLPPPSGPEPIVDLDCLKDYLAQYRHDTDDAPGELRVNEILYYTDLWDLRRVIVAWKKIVDGPNEWLWKQLLAYTIIDRKAGRVASWIPVQSGDSLEINYLIPLWNGKMLDVCTSLMAIYEHQEQP